MSAAFPKRYLFLFRAFAFLLSLFFFWRLVFFLVNAPALTTTQFGFLTDAFFHGMRLDIAVSGYALIPLLLASIFKDLPFQAISATRAYLMIISALITVLLSANVVVYHYWRSLLNYRALTYLKDPAEALASVSFTQAAILLLLFASMISLTLVVCRRVMFFPEGRSDRGTRQRIIFNVVWAALVLTAVRGGWQQLPINESSAYFSKEPFHNHTAVNPVWHLAYDIKMAGITRSNPFERVSREKQSELMRFFHPREKSTTRILNTERPNIVIILLESMTADVVGCMRGDSGLTSALDSAVAKGVLFDRIYSSGFRTDQGIVSILNGWPATPYHSIMRSTEKCQLLPSMVNVLKDKGYSSSFYYGGAANFSNLGAYLQLQGFEKIATRDSFPAGGSMGRWGYHDEYVLRQQLQDLDRQEQPFFSTLVTLSNHEPFDVPGPEKVPGNDEPSRFRNAVRYTDDALNGYFKEAAGKPWFKNTLFVLVADHAHSLPRKRDILYPHGRHIPMVLTGPVIVDSCRGMRISTLGGHHDLPATLAAQLGLDSRSFAWSKDLLDAHARPFAYLPLDDNLLWKSEAGWFLYDFRRDSIIERSFLYDGFSEAITLARAKAFMQAHYDAYLQY